MNGITVETGTRLTSLGTGWNGTAYKVNFEGDSYDYNCFTLNDTTITSYRNYCNAIVDLTKTVQGKTITEIGNNAFNNMAVTNITLSNNITSVGTSAFENNDIEILNMAYGLTTIGERAFYNTGLITVSIPESVTSIGANALANNNELSSITVVGKASESEFTSLGSNWNGTCNNIIYEN